MHLIKKIAFGIVLNGLALYLVTLLLKDIQYVGGIKFLLIGGFIIGFLNTFVKPLMKIMSFPLMFMTIGLFSIVINVVIFWLTTRIINGINVADVSVTIASPLTYLWAAVIFGLVNFGIHLFIHNK